MSCLSSADASLALKFVTVLMQSKKTIFKIILVNEKWFYIASERVIGDGSIVSAEKTYWQKRKNIANTDKEIDLRAQS